MECPFAYYNNIIIGNWRSPDRDGSLFRHSTTDRRRAGGNPVVPHPPPHLNIDYIPNLVHRHGYYNLEECLIQCLQRGIRLLRRSIRLILNSFIARIKIHPPLFYGDTPTPGQLLYHMSVRTENNNIIIEESERAIQKGRPTLNQCSLGRSLRVRKSETDSHVTAPRHPLLYYTTPLRLLPRGGGFALLDLPLPGLAWPAACSAEWFDVSAMARSGGLNK